MQPTNRKRLLLEAGLIVILGVATWLSRLPFQPRWLDSSDGVNYALAVDHFDVRIDQPQAPGYYLYILGVRAMKLVVHDSARALFNLSSLASALAVIAVYLVGREMLGRRAGLVAGLMLGTSTVFWYQSEIASPYAGDLALSALVGWLAFRARRTRRTTDLLLAALMLGISGAYRPQTFFFLAPLLLYALWGRSWKLWLAGGATASVSAALLFLPAILASGGLSGYVHAVFDLARTNVGQHQAAFGYRRYVGNVIVALKDSFYGVGELVLLLAGIGALRQLWQRRFGLMVGLALWVLPAWLVFFLLYPGNPGTVLVCVPPFFIWAASNFAESQVRWQKVQSATLGAVLVWQVALFVWLPERALGQSYRSFQNASALRWVEGYVDDLFAVVDGYPPDSTTVVVYEHWRHLQYYRPEYLAYSKPETAPDLPNEILQVIESHHGQAKELTHVPAESLIPPTTQHILVLEAVQDDLSASTPWLRDCSRGGLSAYAIDIVETEKAVWTLQGFILEPREGQSGPPGWNDAYVGTAWVRADQ